MIIGVPRETKPDEYRVGLLPVGAAELVSHGHTVLVQRHAGEGSGYADDHYVRAGATLVDEPAEVFTAAEMMIKVKEPQPHEVAMLRQGQIVFTYFHFAADRDLTLGCLEKRIAAVAYETLAVDGRLPLLTPMSEVAGRMAIQQGAKYLERPQEGRGILLSGVPGVEPAKVTVLGGGIVGANAAKVAAGLGANVVIMDIDLDRLRYLDDVMPANVRTIHSNPESVAWHCCNSDLVVGAVLIPGARSPVLVPKTMLKDMRDGSVIVDVGVDQGGCVETTKPTTHAEPTYVIDGVVHYCVANMPGAVGRTSTQALCHATQPWAVQLANSQGDIPALVANYPAFASALNLIDGRVTHPGVAAAHDLEHQPL
ncbi:MAG: alanine dehydrogenase [Planctomycetota bacterium]